MSRTTPLHPVHVDLGATLTSFAGFEMPLRYGSDRAEHRAVREGAGIFDLSHMGELEVVGPGASAALDHALVGDFGTLAVGRARYSLLCAEDGGILDDLVGYRLSDDRYLLVVNAANTAVAHEALCRRAAGHDVEVEDVSERTALIAVQGPASHDVLVGMTTADLSAVRSYRAVQTSVAGVSVLLARTGYTGEDGFELFCASDRAMALWAALTGVVRDRAPWPCGLAARDTLRLEAGMPLYGHELTREHTPYEAGLGRLVSFDKDARFVGRGALAELARSRPARTLVGLVAEGRRAPRHGYPVLSPDGRIGAVTSGALSPSLGTPVAMAYVAEAFAEPGTSLTVDLRGRPLPVEVVALPFYRPER